MQYRRLISLLLLLGMLAGGFVASHAQDKDEPETVLVVYRPKAGQEAALLEVLKKDWATVKRLKLVDEQPHLLVQAKDDAGKTVFVETFTWVSAETPDHVPAEVQAIWGEMGKLVETREGHPGVDFRAVSVLADR